LFLQNKLASLDKIENAAPQVFNSCIPVHSVSAIVARV